MPKVEVEEEIVDKCLNLAGNRCSWKKSLSPSVRVVRGNYPDR